MSSNRIILNVITDFKEDHNTNSVLIINAVNQVIRTETLTAKIKDLFDVSLSSNLISIEELLKLMVLLPDAIKLISTYTSLTKSLDVNDSKYVIYALLFQYLSICEPQFLNDVDEKQLREIFNNFWTLVSFLPREIKIAKSKLSFCCGTSIKNQPY